MLDRLRYKGVTAVTDSAAVGVVHDSFDNDGVGLTSYSLGYNHRRVAQSWDAGASVSELTGATVFLRRTGQPRGVLMLNIKAHSGTYGTSSVPTGGILVGAIPIAVDATISTSETLYFGALSGLTPSTNTKYTLEIDGNEIQGDVSNHCSVRVDTSPSHGGNFSTNATGIGAYTAVSGEDAIFKIYSVSGSGGASSSKAGANIGSGFRGPFGL